MTDTNEQEIKEKLIILFSQYLPLKTTLAEMLSFVDTIMLGLKK